MILIEENLPPGLRKFILLMVKIKTVMVVILLPILPITFFGVVFFRYILEQDLFAYEEWLLLICFWIFFLSSALGTFYGKQINADLLDTITDNHSFMWLRKIAVTVIELVITVIILHWAWLMLSNEIADYPRWKTTIALKIPFFLPRLGIFVGFFFMSLYSALSLYLICRAGPDRYVEAVQTDKQEIVEGGDVSW